VKCLQSETNSDLAVFADAVGRLMPRLLRGLLARERNALSRGRLTVPQLSVLDHVAGAGPCTMGAIAAMFNMKRPTVTGVVDRLVRLGFLRRSHGETDRRAVVAVATESGRRVVATFHGERRRTIARMFDGVGPTDRMRFLATMKEAVERIERTPERRTTGAQ
jgi:DNA-binding MarR family transcriptional regulator